MNEKKVMISYKYYFFLLEKKLTNAVFPRGACTTVGTVTRRRDESKKDTKKVGKERQNPRKKKSNFGKSPNCAPYIRVLPLEPLESSTDTTKEGTNWYIFLSKTRNNKV